MKNKLPTYLNKSLVACVAELQQLRKAKAEIETHIDRQKLELKADKETDGFSNAIVNISLAFYNYRLQQLQQMGLQF